MCGVICLRQDKEHVIGEVGRPWSWFSDFRLLVPFLSIGKYCLQV